MSYLETTIGRCSICGGEVRVPSIWNGVIPPVPTCSRCGATGQDSGTIDLPTIPMTPTAPAQPFRTATRPDTGEPRHA